MKRIAIAEPEGVALDWAVAAATWPGGMSSEFNKLFWEIGFKPTTDWSQCGPLIERYKVGIEQTREEAYAYTPEEPLCGFFDHRPRVAACRAIVASHNPDGFVEVPDELVEES